MKILNLYAGIGGNRKLWGDEHEVTAVEYDEATAETYKKLFPSDKVFITDAHQFLMDNFREFDFIWSSPPCPTHSRINHAKTRKPDYADMRLYQEIIFLNHWFKGKFVIENVIPFYKPLMPAQEIDRHLFWSNFKIQPFEPKQKAQIRMQGGTVPFEKIFGFDISNSKIKDKRKALRNCVHPETGLHILNCALNTLPKKAIHSLFDDSVIYL
ncbi:DNA cytosine methyltransferase [Elizabethkingia anophelis]|nr:DNA cytosine methyltransferase [Elizabethkingia anophelis]